MEFFPRDQVEEGCCCIEFVIASHLKKSTLEGKSLCPRSFTRVAKQNGTCRGGKGSGRHIGREMARAAGRWKKARETFRRVGRGWLRCS
mmetsp:Transcript_14961/g.29102  ORF Transcript_14961/g.29102 Transcript_14961/m.29102 type:complete len:89 (+) Transcript_14961:462-728(+)